MMYLVRKTLNGSLLLSNQKPTSVMGKMFFPGDKFQTKPFQRNILSSNYFKNLKRGDLIPWVIPAGEQVILDNGTTLNREYVDIDWKEFDLYVKADSRFTPARIQNIFPTFFYKKTNKGILLTTFPVVKKLYQSDNEPIIINPNEGLNSEIWIPEVEFVFFPSKYIDSIEEYQIDCYGIKEPIIYPIFKSLDNIENNYFSNINDDQIWWGEMMTFDELLNNQENFKRSIIDKYNNWYEKKGESAIDEYLRFWDRPIEEDVDPGIYPDGNWRHDPNNDWMDSPDDYWNID